MVVQAFSHFLEVEDPEKERILGKVHPHISLSGSWPLAFTVFVRIARAMQNNNEVTDITPDKTPIFIGVQKQDWKFVR